MDRNITEYEEVAGVAVYVILVFDIIAIYNVVELTFMIWAGFKRHADLCFWVYLVATYGVAAYTVGCILKTSVPSVKGYFYLTLMEVGWTAMVTGQSMVLWSRLHLIMRNPFRLKMILWMIIINAIICHIPKAMLTYGTNTVNLIIWDRPYSFYERAQVTIFVIQELIISGIYTSKTSRLMRHGHTTHETPWGVDLMQRLVLVNIVLILLDTTILGLVYAGYYNIQASYQSFVYSVKLKMEFTILKQLTTLQADKKTQHSTQQMEPPYRTDTTYLVIARGVGEHKGSRRGWRWRPDQGSVSLTLAGVCAIAPLRDIIDPSVGAFNDNIDKSEDFCMAAQVSSCAHFSTAMPNTVASVIIRREGGEDEENDEDDMVEVKEVPVAEKGLEGDGHRMRVLSGELPMIRAEYVGLASPHLAPIPIGADGLVVWTVAGAKWVLSVRQLGHAVALLPIKPSQDVEA
ncbi:hypothetical protein Purlil1_12411 [Purpureocillium lilacinum]|uniref:DUF7703 domain-containing protein n=1 Tax=Purpureocillium lilacinum TaxID=33203 RepID=A0ABR0BH53_PURLI|nr:hypothetical protein Purlil1_12411 [Purpureocillium lilacinum]